MIHVFCLVYRENIFGYKGLKIDLWLTADSMKAYLRMKADETLTPEKCEGVTPDPVIEPMRKLLAPDQATQSLEDFQATVAKADRAAFQPFGSKIGEFKVESSGEGGQESCFEVRICFDDPKRHHRHGTFTYEWLEFRKITEEKDMQCCLFQVYQSTVADQGFKDYHERFQFFIMFFIDAASYIDVDDDKWIFFTL